MTFKSITLDIPLIYPCKCLLDIILSDSFTLKELTLNYAQNATENTSINCLREMLSKYLNNKGNICFWLKQALPLVEYDYSFAISLEKV